MDAPAGAESSCFRTAIVSARQFLRIRNGDACGLEKPLAARFMSLTKVKPKPPGILQIPGWRHFQTTFSCLNCLRHER
jgi:hypothetical protein